MRSHARVWVLMLICGVLLAGLAPAAAQAAFGVEFFQSLTCEENEPEGEPGECSVATPGQFFKQAGGHPDFGITDFVFNHAVAEDLTEGGGVKSIRTDLPVGFSTNPRALPMCSQADFAANFGKAEASHCKADTVAGTQELTIAIPAPTNVVGTVYNLEPAPGLPLEFGIDIPLPFLGGIHVHSLLEGFVSWHKEEEATKEGIESGDYHEFFKIKVAKSLAEGEAPIVRSRLVSNGTAGKGLLTNPTACPGPQTTHLRVETYTGKVVTSQYTTTPTAAEEECGEVEFEPSFSLSANPTTQDEGTALTTDLKFPINEESSEIENSDLKKTVVKLPVGYSINPSAAHGLQACTEAELNTSTVETECPVRSEIGTAVLNVPGLPLESLTGKIFLGSTETPITHGPYTIYVAVGSNRYGQAVRLKGIVEANPETGQLTTTFDNNPQGPFEDLKLVFNGGTFADLATPLKCGAAPVAATFTPYANPAESTTLAPELTVTGGNCPSAPFALSQSTSSEPASGGGSSTFTFNLARNDGQQYLHTVRTVLPPGLVGTVPDVTQCAEPAAGKGECTSASQIGTAVVTAGTGTEPFEFRGKVYFTGPYQGAPYGLSIVTPVVAGPFNFGNEVTRAKIEVNPSTAQIIATSTLPTIKQGIPIRLRSLSVTVNRQGFERNPTNCALLNTESELTSTEGAVQKELRSPFQAEGCSSLSFGPKFTASTSAKTSRVNGASLVTTLTQGSGQANIKSVKVQLPKQLPSRLSTLQKACTEAQFAANPSGCPAGSKVGTATVDHAGPSRQDDRSGLLRLPRRRGVPRSRPGG